MTQFRPPSEPLTTPWTYKFVYEETYRPQKDEYVSLGTSTDSIAIMDSEGFEQDDMVMVSVSPDATLTDTYTTEDGAGYLTGGVIEQPANGVTVVLMAEETSDYLYWNAISYSYYSNFGTSGF